MTENPFDDGKDPDSFPFGEGTTSSSSEASSVEETLSAVRMQAAFAGSVARSWIEKHQEETMIGAFAVGVFVGALMRR